MLVGNRDKLLTRIRCSRFHEHSRQHRYTIRNLRGVVRAIQSKPYRYRIEFYICSWLCRVSLHPSSSKPSVPGDQGRCRSISSSYQLLRYYSSISCRMTAFFLSRAEQATRKSFLNKFSLFFDIWQFFFYHSSRDNLILGFYRFGYT